MLAISSRPALKMVHTPSNAARLLPKPMLPNAAKITRMIMRRQKRTSTWVDFNSRGRFGTCAKIRSSYNRSLAEIIAADRLVERVCVTTHGGDACPASGRSDALGVDEGAHNRQR